MQGAAQSSLIGATIGNYRVVSKLGEGGMGSVYLAEHPLIGKKVALKVLHEEYSSNPDVVNRFFTEAKAVNDIGHPNIVDIVDFGHVQPERGAPFVYFIMEFLNGESLAQVLAKDAPLSIDRALAITMQVADALAASHAKGIVHRDLKPDNIYVIMRGREKDFAKVLDFGIAKLTGDTSGSSKTRTGIVMGTPAYMSPEQCEGRGNIDHRTDVYALGIVLYELITGRVPFLGEGYGEILVQHLTKQPPLPSTIREMISPHVEAIVMKSLSKNRDHRYQNMEQFIAAMRDPQGFVEANGGLDAFYAESAPTATPRAPTAVQPVAKAPTTAVAAQPRPTTLTGGAGEVAGGDLPMPPRSKTPLLAVGAAAVLVLAGGGYFLMGGAKPAPAPVTMAAPVAPPVAAAPVVPAPEPPKPVEHKPVEATEVTLSLTSDPLGADVWIHGETAARGKTPLDLKLPRVAGGQQELVFKLEGYKDKIKSVRLNRDGEVEVTLAKDRSWRPASHDAKPPRTPKVVKEPKKGGSGDDVLNPSSF